MARHSPKEIAAKAKNDQKPNSLYSNLCFSPNIFFASVDVFPGDPHGPLAGPLHGHGGPRTGAEGPRDGFGRWRPPHVVQGDVTADAFFHIRITKWYFAQGFNISP